MAKHSNPEDGKTLQSWRWQNMVILTKAKHSEGQEGKRGGAMGYENLLTTFKKSFIFINVSRAWKLVVKMSLNMHIWTILEVTCPFHGKQLGWLPTPTSFMFCLCQDHHVLPSSGLQCLAIFRIGMFCHNQDCNVLPKSGLLCSAIFWIKVFCHHLE